MKIQYFFLVLLVICLVTTYIKAQTTPQVPKLAEAFKANITYLELFNPKFPIKSPGHVYYDKSQEGYRLNWNTFIGIYPTRINTTTLFHGDTSVTFYSDQCMDSGGSPFYDLWGFLYGATSGGRSEVNGIPCDIWYHEYPFGVNYTVCVDANDSSIPIQYLFTLFDEETHESQYSIGIDFKDFSPGAQNPQIFDIPEYCFKNITCQSGDVEKMQVLRFHSDDYWGLENKNSADLIGDTSFMCTTLSFDIHGYDTLISLIDVQYNTTWGQYSFCNGDSCIGGNDFTVGHEVTEGIGAFGSQCNVSQTLGNWYSTRKGAHCLNDDPVGTNGCAWKIDSIVKTISKDCLIQNGFIRACFKDDMQIPFPKASQVLANSIKYDDPSEGGCPNVPPPDNINQQLHQHYTPKNQEISKIHKILQRLNSKQRELLPHYSHLF